MSLRPLEGYLVGVTADRRWEEQAELLGRRGASILHGPTIQTQYLEDSDENLHAATAALLEHPPDYVVATTGIGMRAWLKAASTWNLGDALVTAISNAKVAARGPKAAAAVQAGGIPVWARAETERMEDLVDLLLAEPLAGKAVAVQEYGVPIPWFLDALRGANANVVNVPVYRWYVPEDTGPAQRLVEAACEGRLDAVTFTSAPAVHNLFAIAAESGAAEDLRRAFQSDVVAACVGPVCAAGAREEGIDAPLAPSVGRMGLLIRALTEHFEARRRTLRCGDADLVVQGSVVAVDGEPIELAPDERAVLAALAGPAGAVVSADEDVIGRLRARLGPCGAAIQPSRGGGYRLDAG